MPLKTPKSRTGTPAEELQATKAPAKSYSLLLSGLCMMLAGFLYINTLNHDFAVDDSSQIVKNRIVQKGPAGIGEILNTPYRAGYSDEKESIYRPLSMIVFALEWGISPEDPKPGHIVNIVLYMLLAAVVFNTYRLMLPDGSPAIPFLAALLFTAHPLHTEVVANIKSLDEILCLLFSLIAINCFIRWGRGASVLYAAIGTASALLAVFSKEIAVTLVILIPFSMWYFSNAARKKIIPATALSAVVVALYLVQRVRVLGALSNFEQISDINNSLAAADGDLSLQLPTAIMLMGKYLLMLFVPWPLSRDYAYQTFPNVSLTEPAALLSLAVILVLIYYVIKNIKKRSPVVYGIAFFAITIALVSNILFLIEAPFGERFTFMPSFGFGLAFTVFLSRIFRNKNAETGPVNFIKSLAANRATVIIVITMTTVFSFLTVYRNPAWKDDFSLYLADLPTCPKSARLHFGYGKSLILLKAVEEKDPVAKKDLINEGITELETAVELAPGYLQVWYMLGETYAKERKDYKLALNCFRNAWSNIYEKDDAYFNSRGIAYGELKKYDSAFSDFRRAIDLSPQNAAYQCNLANYLIFGNKPEEARGVLEKTLKQHPESATARYLMGNYFASRSEFITAISWYDSAISAKPDYASAWKHAGNSFGMLKKYDQALKYMLKAEQLEPGDERNRMNIVMTYKALGRDAEAQAFLQ